MTASQSQPGCVPSATTQDVGGSANRHTQAQRIAQMERLRAEGILPRYRINLPKRGETFASRRGIDQWLRRTFGPRSSGRAKVRVTERVFHRHYDRLKAQAFPKLRLRVRRAWPSRACSRLFWRQRSNLYRAMGLNDD